jgi:3-methylcrotonyl-CoA carboxylase beta subunit
MDVLETKIDVRGAEFAANRDRMLGLVEELRGHLTRARAGGGDKAQARHREQNKMFVRDRVDKLLDAGSPFLELGALAAHELYDGRGAVGGVVTGIGRSTVAK